MKEDMSTCYVCRSELLQLIVKQIKNDIASIQQKIDGLTKTTEKEIWISELDEFEKAYSKWLSSIENEEMKTKARRVKKNNK